MNSAISRGEHWRHVLQLSTLPESSCLEVVVVLCACGGLVGRLELPSARRAPGSVVFGDAYSENGGCFGRIRRPTTTHSESALICLDRQKTGHFASPLVRQRLDAFLNEWGDKGQTSPAHIRFVTYTTRFNRGYWVCHRQAMRCGAVRNPAEGGRLQPRYLPASSSPLACACRSRSPTFKWDAAILIRYQTRAGESCPAS
jgi:hypothetical protein